MKINKIFIWFPFIIFIIIICLSRNYFNYYIKEAYILEKILEIILIISYLFYSIQLGIIVIILLIIFHLILLKLKEGFDIKDAPNVLNIFKEHTNKKIPKRIIQVWKTWSSKKPEMFSLYIESIKNMNPTYEYMFFKDEQIDDFLKKYYPEYYETYNKLPMNIQKMDFCRYVLLYHFGGFYFDLDINALEPLDELLESECVFPIDEIINKNMCINKRFKGFCNNNIDFLLGQYAFGCCPKNRFVKTVIDVIHKNIDNYVNSYIANSEDYVYTTTGPDFITSLYMNYPDKESIKVLYYDKRQYFGKYAKHNYAGTWKTTK